MIAMMMDKRNYANVWSEMDESCKNQRGFHTAMTVNYDNIILKS